MMLLFSIFSGARKLFIVSKYVDKKYVNKFVDENEIMRLLLESVLEANLLKVVHLYASGVDLNVVLNQVIRFMYNTYNNASLIFCGSYKTCPHSLSGNHGKRFVYSYSSG